MSKCICILKIPYLQDFIDDMIVILYESKLNFVGKSFSYCIFNNIYLTDVDVIGTQSVDVIIICYARFCWFIMILRT